ncbi:complex I subunit 5 family protein [Clostridium grantii]|uniref:Formate hydrogenlyase subunit 3/Multisubunit Na+/H+ antiporter, MnhD subunit n=1 Tax=Clostridium grantii DSM 8605 TaxID=1121316 RepID=A0A1M5UIJ2_9CLOT|nr:complex I subunit 5 family protein [Clostridium grantii]SHH62718.1 Formate hydrogenlyase subunit 3/Multisubunit Na+/H+ antiporter, MnhD subunit [Clostridium grantii DSM 8605]
MNEISLLIFIMIFPLFGSAIGFLIGLRNEKYRDIFNVLMTGITFAAVMALWKFVTVSPVEIKVDYIMGTGLYLKVDVFRYVFVWLTSFIWFLVTIYSTQYLISYKNRNRYYLFFMLTLWSTIGIFLSENLLNLFTFFEIMSLTTYPLVIHDEDVYAHDAGDTYITMAVIGGLVLLMGLFLVYDYTGTLVISEIHYKFQEIGSVKYLISGLMIFGFGVKAGMFPLHVWLPKAHPASPAPASAILSGILLKTGIYGILIITEFMLEGDLVVSTVVLILGFITMFTGGLLAIFQRNIKRILAYSSMSQMGYILVGIALMGFLGEHKAIALYGSIFHIINHAIYKVLLFLGAGLVYMVLHELSINKIGGFGIKQKRLKMVFFIGLCAIIGLPGFSGFASKTLLHHALSEATHIYGGLFYLGEAVFIISSAFTVAYLMKIFIAVFVEESDHDIENIKAKITKRALMPMIILGGLIIFIGLNPQFIMNILDKVTYSFDEIHKLEKFEFYNFENIKSSLITISLGVVIYYIFVRKVLRKGQGIHWYYENIALNWFNLNVHVYRPLGRAIIIVSSILLKIVDESLTTIALLTSNAVELIGEKEIDMSKRGYSKVKKMVGKNLNVKLNFSEMNKNLYSEKDVEYITHILEGEEKLIVNIKEGVKKARTTFNSVNYSIFIFAIVLIVFLVVMII